ncbi:MAG: MmgE/PrpD family protein [Candidatus Binatia bacterium]
MATPEPIARRLATRVVAWRDGTLPDAVLRRAHELLLDFVGVAVGGAGEASSVVLRRGLAALGLAGTATVIGTGDRLAVPAAACANGAAAHALEMDDTHQGGSIHLGASVFPAALAAAELVGATGDAVLRAAVAGYEVGARLAMALDPAAHYRRGFHPTGTCGAFAAATAAGLILGLDANAIAAALGIAGSQAAGSMEFLADGAWTKRLHPGWAAQAGLHAASLARAGFVAPATIFEGRFGVLAAYSDAPRTAPLLADDRFELLDTAVKPHACCRYMQGPIDAALALRTEHEIDPAAIETIDVGVLAAGWAIVCEPEVRKRHPTSVVDLQFSLPFGVAAALARGAASPDEFALATLDDPDVRSLMDRVRAVRDPALDACFPRAWPAWMRIRLRDGRTLERHVAQPLGDPENFLDPDALRAKLRRLAGRTLPPPVVERLVIAANGVPEAPAMDALLAATRPPAT